ncbi:polysaccharide biosynthesis tyrosine autokinase [Ruminococcus sp.]|uniref:polysaccharide biosynthesis tyrosine autokinase n=1 Tax=Ruminococcus sp. TaxID=41978 RepID=UPI0025F04F74|nr:polysaccharide biosynthesis tyrosine autokinase [Ruminococcus sp.]
MKPQENEEITIDIMELLRVFLHRIPLILAAAILCGSIGFGYASFFLPKEYTSSTYMYVKNNNQEKEAIDQQDLAASKSLIDTYIVILQNHVVVREVGNHLMEQYGETQVSSCFSVTDGAISPDELKNCVTMQSDGNTEVLKISATTKDPEISAAICDIYAEVAPSFLIRIVGAGSVEIIGAAEISAAPSAPDIPKITLIAAFCGFALTCIVIFLFHFLDTHVRSETDFQQLDVPYLGEIPNILDTPRKKQRYRAAITGDTDRIALHNTLPFHIVEAYRAIRNNLTFSLATKSHRILAVTSANASEGKSTVLANLAYIQAMTEKKVLLIDADLRRPVQHQYLKLTNTLGLSEVLARTCSFDEAIHRNVAPNLDVLTAGTCPPNPSELLSSSIMGQLLSQAEQDYDYVMLDAPPVNVVSDILGLSSEIGGIILIAKYGFTTRDDVRDALRNISMTDTSVLGIVMNHVKCPSSGYGSGKYKKYSCYNSYDNAKESKETAAKVMEEVH